VTGVTASYDALREHLLPEHLKLRSVHETVTPHDFRETAVIILALVIGIGLAGSDCASRHRSGRPAVLIEDAMAIAGASLVFAER
jgi:hypothetical protein